MSNNFSNIRTKTDAQKRFRELTGTLSWFSGVNDPERAKSRHRSLARELHPDAGGTTEDFQKMQEEYEVWKKFRAEYEATLVLIEDFPELLPEKPKKKKSLAKKLQKQIRKPEYADPIIDGARNVASGVVGAFFSAVLGRK